MSAKFDYTIEYDPVKFTSFESLKKIRFDQVSLVNVGIISAKQMIASLRGISSTGLLFNRTRF